MELSQLSQLLRLIRARRAQEVAPIPRFIIDPEKIPDGDVDAEIARIEATLPEDSKNGFFRAIFRVLVDPERAGAIGEYAPLLGSESAPGATLQRGRCPEA